MGGGRRATSLPAVLPSLPSADPEEEADAGVKTVVGSTFDAIVLDPSKDVLIELYAPWCVVGREEGARGPGLVVWVGRTQGAPEC